MNREQRRILRLILEHYRPVFDLLDQECKQYGQYAFTKALAKVLERLDKADAK